jgi:hypothetical protein
MLKAFLNEYQNSWFLFIIHRTSVSKATFYLFLYYLNLRWFLVLHSNESKNSSLASVTYLHISWNVLKYHLQNEQPNYNWFLTFRGPCIVIHSYDKSRRDALFHKFISVKNSTRLVRSGCSILTSLADSQHN